MINFLGCSVNQFSLVSRFLITNNFWVSVKCLLKSDLEIKVINSVRAIKIWQVHSTSFLW